MTWLDWHQQSETLASQAGVARRGGDFEKARNLYSEAAKAEVKALAELDGSKDRTRGITAVSAVSLWFKGARYDEAEQLAYLMLGAGTLPDFAALEMRTLVHAIWTESTKRESGVQFLPGQVFVSVKGGEVVTGGAPLDLVVDKVQTLQSMFYRTIEESRKLPLRRRGAPSREIQEACRPWLFQAPPGSFQFSVAIQGPAQLEIFGAPLNARDIAERLLEILRASISEDTNVLQELVSDKEYRSTFLKLARNLAPTGRAFEKIELRTVTDSQSVGMGPESRRAIQAALRKTIPRRAEPEESEVIFNGVLRAVHLDRDWIEVQVDGHSYHIIGLKDALDDVIGPMVNRKVIVIALKGPKEMRLLDIELDE